MRVQTKIISMLLFLSIIFIAVRYLYQGLENKRMYALFEADNEEKVVYFDKLRRLQGANLEVFAFDYTYWDEMAAFIRNKDIAWAKTMMDETVLKTYRVDGIWIFDTGLSLLYSIKSQAGSEVKDFPLPIEAIKEIFLKERLRHFFVNTSAGLMEIRCATVHPTADPQRKTLPQGYFFAGRLWDKEYTSEFAGLMEGKIKITGTEEKIPGFEALAARNSIIFYRRLADWKGGPAAYIYVTIEAKNLQTYKLFSRNAGIMFIVFLISVIIFITVFLTSSVSAPLAMISQALKTERPPDPRILEKDTSEFGDIARLISKFFEQRQELVKEIAERKKAEDEIRRAYEKLKTAQAQLVQSAKMASIGQLAGGIAHEINNPLTGVLNNVQLIKMEEKQTGKLNAAAFKELLGIIEESALRCKRITQSLLDFSYASKGAVQAVSLNELIEKVIELIGYEMKRQSIVVRKEFAPDLPKVSGDSQRLQQVVFDILANAKWAIGEKALKSGGSIIIKTEYKPEDKEVSISVTDNGIGIPPENLQRIFEPFFTTKRVGEGTGLGLSIAYNIIKEHKGRIEVESRVGEGSTFIIKLPL